jgi:hypothetical protein
MPRPHPEVGRWFRIGAALVLLLTFVACGGAAQSPTPEGPNVSPNQVPVGFGTATLNWTPVITDTNGTPLADLAGYKIYYGSSAADMETLIVVADPSATTYLVGNLTSGSWYFTVTAYTSGGTESARSNIGSKMVP